MKNIALKSLLFFISAFFFLGMGLHAQKNNRSLERHWQSGAQKVRVISYNIMNGFDWKKDTDREARLVNWVSTQDPDVLALEELCGFKESDLKALAKKWGHPYVAIVKEGGYPVGITSKKPILVINRLVEGYGHGLLHVKTYDMDFLVTHLNPHGWKKRHEEAKHIVQYIEQQKLNNCLLMGDMNSLSPTDADYMEQNACPLLLKRGGKDSKNLDAGTFDYSTIAQFLAVPLYDACRYYTNPEERYTFPTRILMSNSKNKEVLRHESERIDYIFLSASLHKNLVDAFIYNNEETDYLSDHYPIGIDLFFTK